MNTNIYFEEKLINKAGVDRLVFSHVELIEINRSILHSAVTESSNLIFDDLKVYNRTYYVTNNGDRFHHMRISDPEIGTLTFGANPQKYGIWEFSPCNFRDGNNLVNFSSRELIDYLEYAAKLLNERFGLVISFFNSILKEIELNTTFALRYAFSDYYRPLSVLFLRMPYLKKQCEYSGTENKGKKLHSCSTFNKQISVTAYNKSLEMAVNLKSKERILVYDEDGVIVDSDLMRVEFKLKTAEICKKYISGDNLDGLKHLLKSYAGQVKCVYIDPPYNTGTDGFVYNDKFNFTAEDLVEKLSIDDEQAQHILDLTNRGSASHSASLTRSLSLIILLTLLKLILLKDLLMKLMVNYQKRLLYLKMHWIRLLKNVTLTQMICS